MSKNRITPETIVFMLGEGSGPAPPDDPLRQEARFRVAASDTA